MKARIPMSVLFILCSLNLCFGYGSISGTVTDPGGTAIGNAYVYLYEKLGPDWWQGQSGQNTGPDGSYGFNNLSEGEYIVRTYPPYGTDYITLYYNQSVHFNHADSISLGLDENRTNINFQMITGGYITGIVRDPNGAPLQNVWVEAMGYQDGFHYDSDYTALDGRYTIGPLPPGSYRTDAQSWQDNFIRQHYDHQIDWNQADPVTVNAGQTTTDIDFDLELGASVEGHVYDPNGMPVYDVYVDMYCESLDFGKGSWTDENGYYKIPGLPAGVMYRHSCRPEGYDDLQTTGSWVSIPSVASYRGYDFHLLGGALTVSGQVYDRDTLEPVGGLWVGGHIEDIDAYAGSCETDPCGFYIIKNIPPCDEFDIWVDTDGTEYATMGAEIEVYENIENMDFALFPGLDLYLQLVDIDTGQPVPYVEVSCDNEQFQSWHHEFTNERGLVAIEGVIGGFNEIIARPSVSSGYCWSYGWPESLIYLPENQDYYGHMAVQPGALVTGRFVDPCSNPVAGLELEWQSDTCGGWDDLGSDGTFSVRLPVGISTVDTDNDGFVSLPVDVQVNSSSETIDLGDITVYNADTAPTITGTVATPSGWPTEGMLIAVVFEAGKIINAQNMHRISPVSEAPVQPDASFAIPVVPGQSYDVHLIQICEMDEITETIIVQDSAYTVAAGAGGVSLTYNPGGEITGSVQNSLGLPVAAAYAILTDGTGQLAGFSLTDETGSFRIPDLDTGTYDLAVSHAAYLPDFWAANLTGSSLDVGTVTVNHKQARYGNDLNGDGRIDAIDLALIGEYWLSTYDMTDFGFFSSSWLLKDYWLNE